jgi:serine/threonine protein kinase
VSLAQRSKTGFEPPDSFSPCPRFSVVEYADQRFPTTILFAAIASKSAIRSREEQVLRQLADQPASTGCIQLIDSFHTQNDGTLWLNLVFPYFPRTLYTVIEKESLATDDTARIFGQICTGLSFLHAQNVAHRDLV